MKVKQLLKYAEGLVTKGFGDVEIMIDKNDKLYPLRVAKHEYEVMVKEAVTHREWRTIHFAECFEEEEHDSTFPYDVIDKPRKFAKRYIVLVSPSTKRIGKVYRVPRKKRKSRSKAMRFNV